MKSKEFSTQSMSQGRPSEELSFLLEQGRSRTCDQGNKPKVKEK